MRDLLVRFAIAAASLLLAGTGFIVAVGYLCFAVYLQLTTMMEQPSAAALTALAALLFSVFVLLAARLLTGSRMSRRRMGRGAPLGSGDPAMELGRRMGEDAREFVNAHKGSTLITSLLAGFALGASPKLRGWVRDILGI